MKVQWYIFAHISEKCMRRDEARQPKINYGLQYHRVQYPSISDDLVIITHCERSDKLTIKIGKIVGQSQFVTTIFQMQPPEVF